MAELAAPCDSPTRYGGQTAASSLSSADAYGRCRLKGVAVSPNGLRFDPRFGFEDWRQLGGRIAMRASASLWWLGDWLCFGQEQYGQRYTDAVVLTGLDYQTLRNYAMVARRFELSRRPDKLSFQHHAEA